MGTLGRSPEYKKTNKIEKRENLQKVRKLSNEETSPQRKRNAQDLVNTESQAQAYTFLRAAAEEDACILQGPSQADPDSLRMFHDVGLLICLGYLFLGSESSFQNCT